MAKKSSAIPNIDDILKGAAKASDTKKNGTPVIEVDDKTKKIVTEFRKLKKDEDELKAKIDMKGAELITVADPKRHDLMNVKREYLSSVKVPSEDGMSVTISWKHAYVKCDPSNEESIVNFLGREKYDKYFKVMNTIKVKDDLPKDKLADIINKLGIEKFKEYFEVEQNIKPVPTFTTDAPFVFSDDELNELELLGVKQYKAAIKC
jgi:hypothetical protein